MAQLDQSGKSKQTAKEKAKAGKARQKEKAGRQKEQEKEDVLGSFIPQRLAIWAVFWGDDGYLGVIRPF